MESWRIEPRLRPLDADPQDPDQNPPLWKDVTTASVVALILWAVAAVMFG